MDTSNFSLSDIKAVVDDEGGFGGNSGWLWIIILFIILFGGGAWGFGNNNNATDQTMLARAATTQDVADSQWRQEINGQMRQLSNGICDASYNLNNSINQSRYDISDRIANTGYGLNNAITDLAAQQQVCCCENKTLQLENKYDLANAIHEEGEATRALLQHDKIEALQGQVAQLQLQNALCGVVRYPSSTTFTAGMNPFFNGNAPFGGTVF
jgi:hypothetical protein